MDLDKSIAMRIAEDYPKQDQWLVHKQLASITLDHVTARSQLNLDNTKLAVLKLARGDLDELIYLVECAKVDFRDVLLWASKQDKPKLVTVN